MKSKNNRGNGECCDRPFEIGTYEFNDICPECGYLCTSHNYEGFRYFCYSCRQKFNLDDSYPPEYLTKVNFSDGGSMVICPKCDYEKRFGKLNDFKQFTDSNTDKLYKESNNKPI